MKRTLIFLFAVFSAVCSLSAQSIWRRSHLVEVRSQLDQPYYAAAYRHLLSQADSLLSVEPLSVMQKADVPASGDPHDYMSIGRYTWPNPSSPDGLPYIHRDGLSNPEIELYDRNRLGETAWRIETLSLAYFFSQNEEYARKATQLIRTWFLDKATRMNPHLRYAQVVKGVDGNRGRCYGVIDTYSFVSMLDAVALLEGSRSFTARDSRGLRRWFGQLLDWMSTDPLGVEESSQANNHGIAYDAQFIAFALYAERTEQALACLRSFATRRVASQIAPDGSQPRELSRTLSFHYSWYNLSHIIDVVLMGQTLGLSSQEVVGSDGRLSVAIDYLLPYLGREVETWPYPFLGHEAS